MFNLSLKIHVENTNELNGFKKSLISHFEVVLLIEKS